MRPVAQTNLKFTGDLKHGKDNMVAKVISEFKSVLDFSPEFKAVKIENITHFWKSTMIWDNILTNESATDFYH